VKAKLRCVVLQVVRIGLLAADLLFCGEFCCYSRSVILSDN
jgi:hypothetical protein